MQVTVSGRHMNVGDDVRSYCTEKTERLTRYYDRIQSIEVILDGHAGTHEVELIVRCEGSPPFVATEQREDVYAAIDLLMDKMERQLTRHKERLRNRKHPPRTPEESGLA